MTNASSNHIGSVSIDGAVSPTYTLLTNATATGTALTAMPGASYVWSYTAANWNGATATLQALGPDGATYLTVGTPATANGSQGVVIGNNATVRVAISVAVPTTVNSMLT